MGRSKTFTSNYVTKYCAYKMPQKRRRLLASAFRKWFHEEIRPRKFISWADHKFGFRKGEQTFCFDSAGRRVVKTLCQRRMIWFEEFMRTTMTSKKNNRTPRHDKFSANHLSVFDEVSARLLVKRPKINIYTSALRVVSAYVREWVNNPADYSILPIRTRVDIGRGNTSC